MVRQALAFVPLRFLFPQYTIICDLAYKLPIFREPPACLSCQSVAPLLHVGCPGTEICVVCEPCKQARRCSLQDPARSRALPLP